ncbi:hypothetical protein BsWGS_16458 [Bradybaena similaris]
MAPTRNLHLALLFAAMVVVQTVAQICPYSDPKCKCGDQWVSCTGLQQIPPLNTGVNVSQILHLYLEEGNLTSIGKNSLPPGLTEMWVYHQPLINISDDAFDASVATLQHLSFGGPNFNSLPTVLQKLTTLKELMIDDTTIQVWDAAILKHISSTLESLALTNVSLSAWPSWISDFHLLRTIDLSQNSIKTIPDDAFRFIKDSLENLRLVGIGLTQIPQAFSTLPNLLSLELSQNNITDLSEIQRITKFPFAKWLSHLILNSVGLTSIENFSRFESLSTISLNFNRISDVPVGSLPKFLRSLYITDNSLSSVPKDVAGMPNLFWLYLSGNLITTIEPNAFPSSLTLVDLVRNNLTIITNTTFTNLVQLDSLRLDSNPISAISPAAFSSMVALRELHIRNSHMTEIPLALTLFSPQVNIYWTTTQTLSCPCPAPQELVQWFSSLTGTTSIQASCSNGQPIHSYLSGQCGQPKATL